MATIQHMMHDNKGNLEVKKVDGDIEHKETVLCDCNPFMLLTEQALLVIHNRINISPSNTGKETRE